MNFGYHTRLISDNRVKVVGGSFGGNNFDMELVNRLVNAHCPVVAFLPSGRAVFVDREGRQISLYLTVDPLTTMKGQLALKAYREEQAAAEEARRVRAETEAEELATAMLGLSHEEILRRLRGPA